MSQQPKRSTFGRVDLGKLEHASLIKYAQLYRLPTAENGKDLLYQVCKHFNTQQFMLDDEEVLMRLCKALKKVKGQAPGQAAPAAAPAAPARR